MGFILVHDARLVDTEIALNTAHIVAARPVVPQDKGGLKEAATKIVTIDQKDFMVTEDFTFIKQALEASSI